MLRRVTVGLAVAVFLAAAIGLVVVGPDGGDEGSRTQFAPAQTDEFDNTVFRIQIREDGDVRWTIEHERILDDDEEESQFREFAETFRNEETEAFRNFRTRAGRLIEQGSDATGREMAATEFERDAYVDPLNQASGIIEMSFRWENFSQVDGERVFIGDVFDGGWGIVENQRLTIQTREQLVFQTVEPEPDSMTVTGDLAASESVSWFGERQFTDERPRVVMVPPEELVDSNGTASPTPGDGGPADDSPGDDADDGGTGEQTEGSDMERMVLVVGVLVLLGLGGGAAWYSGALSRSGGDGTAAESPRSGGGAGSEVKSTSEPAVPEAELLSDEDRVIQLLEANGGRMKQVNIVEETEWSKSKVSMLLSEMEDDGQISKLRVGRENIISLAGEEPEAAGSPFEEE